MGDFTEPVWEDQANPGLTRHCNSPGLSGSTRRTSQEELESYHEEEDTREEGGICLSANLPSELLHLIFKLLPLRCLLTVGKVARSKYGIKSCMCSLSIFEDINDHCVFTGEPLVAGCCK